MRGRTVWTVAGAVAWLAVSSPCFVAGQSLERQLAELEGVVTFHFEGREGVEGCGDGSISFGGDRWHRWRGDHRESECGPGPVLVVLRLHGGGVRSLDTSVGPRVHEAPGDDADLGRVPPEEAADYLLGLAETGRPSVAEDAIFPAFLAHGVEVWPRLIDLARDHERPEDVRSQALFWVGQEAAGIGTDGLAAVATDEDEDREVRKAAVFALSQRPKAEGVPILMDVARNARDPETRRSAMFWLAESDSPEAIDFFEEILATRR